jgi:oligosaccharide repeat unit polymerase
MSFVGFYLLLLLGLAPISILELNGYIISQYYLLIIYAIVLYNSVKKYSSSNIYVLFLYSFGVFLLGRVILSVFGSSSLDFADKWMNYWLSPKTTLIVNVSISCSILSSALGYSLPLPYKYNSQLNYSNNSGNKNRYFVYRKALVIIIVLIPFTLLKLYYDYSQVSHGYTDLYAGLNRSPFMLRVSWYLTTLLYPILLIYVPTKKKFAFLISLYIFLNLLEFMQGARGSLFRPLLFFLWFYYNVLSAKKIKLRVMLIIMISLSMLSTILLAFRGDDSRVDATPLSSLNYVITSLSGSYYITAYYVDFKDNLLGKSNLYVFGPVIDFPLSFIDSDLRGQSEKKVEKTHLLSHKLSYELSPRAYLSGHGIGGCYIAEMLSLGGIFTVILFSFFVGRFSTYITMTAPVNNISRIMSWYWVQNVIWMARGELLAFIPNMLLTLFLFWVLSKKMRVGKYIF